MKTIIETENRDYTIKYKKVAMKNADGDFIYTDEGSCIGKVKNQVMQIKFFEPVHEGDDTTYTPVTINATEIKLLFNEIIKLELQESEEFLED